LQILPTLKSTYDFDENGTYVIAGGLGGLGRSIVEWMVTRKARNFILLSRSGAEGNETAREMIDDMRKTGVRIEAPRCDVTDEQAVSSVLKGYGQLLPPRQGLYSGVDGPKGTS
jgi:NAD(P)-dependent dehydrogenase (short-subunit alcohol dehydrogenase family)